MSPGVSILVPTFARTGMLAEVIESFRRQTYAGPLEMIIGNECTVQTLLCRVPNVHIHNCTTDETTSQSRCHLAGEAQHDLLCWWDDDDIYLPDFVSLVVAKLRDGEPAARLSHLMTWDEAAAGIENGHPQATCVMRKADYFRVGAHCDSPGNFFDNFWGRAITGGFFHGRHHHEPDGIPVQVVKRTGQSRVRVTAEQGDAGRRSVNNYRALMLNRVGNEESAGAVDIVPEWSRDWSALVAEKTGGGR